MIVIYLYHFICIINFTMELHISAHYDVLEGVISITPKSVENGQEKWLDGVKLKDKLAILQGS